MTKKVRLQIREGKNALSHEIQGELEAAELSLLGRFIELTDRVCECRWVQEGCPVRAEISWKQGESVVTNADLPDWEQIQAFLLRFRPFILQSEGTFFPKICNLIGRKFRHCMIDRALAPMKDLFSGKSLQSQVTVRSNEVVMNSPETVDAWLNAYEFHQDQEKRKFLEDLHRLLPLETSKVFVLTLLSKRLEAVVRLGVLIRLILGQAAEISLQARSQDG